MGEKSLGNHQLLSDPVIGMPGLANEAAKLAVQHGLTRSTELELLIDHLFGLSCRDQGAQNVSISDRAARRRQGFTHAHEIRKEASNVRASIQRLLAAYSNFHEVVGDNPALLEAIFDADLKGPEELFLPAELNILQTAFYDERESVDKDPIRAATEAISIGFRPADPMVSCPRYLWESIDARLQLMENLPIRPALNSGRMANVVLAKGVARCRDFWIHHEQRSWTMSSLKEKVVREENKINCLKGECEKFVADILTISGLFFTLASLMSAWSAVDKAAQTGDSDKV